MASVVRSSVGARILPQQLFLDTCDDVLLVDEVIEEAVPFVDGDARVCEHVP